MKLFRLTILFSFLCINLYANKIVLEIHTNKIENANVVLITAKSTKHSQLKAILNDKEVLFNKHPFKSETFYALVPFHYFLEQKTHQLIVTYITNNKNYFEGFDIELTEGTYEEEEIKVSSSKVTLSVKNKSRTSKEYKEAIGVYNDVTSKTYWYDDFIYPINSKITSNFGTKRVYNNKTKSYHTGIDFKAKIGTKIKASNNGIVRISKNRFYAGNSIIIDHGHGVYTCYYHLDKMFVNKGDFVQRGDTIGVSGNSGRSTGPHLHFATFINGIQISPVNAIKILNSLNE